MIRSALAALAALRPVLLLADPSVYPTGTTIFHPDETWSGYTVLDTPGEGGTVLVDMNGSLLERWTEVAAVPGPFRVLPATGCTSMRCPTSGQTTGTT